MLEHLSHAAEKAAEAAADESPSGAKKRKEAAVAAAGWQGTQLRLTVAVLDSLKKELARERAALASARAEAKASDAVAEQALGMLQALREESAELHANLASLEEAKLRTEQALVKRDKELFDLGRAQHQAARALGVAIAGVEERTFAALQKIDARCEARTAQLNGLQGTVSQILEAKSDQRLDQWTQSLREPMAPKLRSRDSYPGRAMGSPVVG